MTLPSRRIADAVRVIGCLAVLALLSACASSRNISATQEAAHYEQQARRNYVAPGSASDPWGPYIQEASARYDVPERWIREVMRVESGGRTELNGMPITSGAGAMGLMQVMPATYDELRSRYSLGDDPYDPHNSILAGTAYIRELYDLYGSPGFLAAYNSGPGRLDDYLTRNRPLPDETRRYVAKIGPYITDSFPTKRSTAELYAMNSLPTSIPAGPRYNTPADSQTAAYVPPASAPVEVAYAPPADNDGAFDPPPGWRPPSGMTRSEVAAYVPPSAAAPPPPSAPPPPPAASQPAPAVFEPAPMPIREPVQMASLPEPPPPPRYTPPVPPPYTPPSRVQTAALYQSPPPQTLQHHEGFRLVAPAMAAPAPVFRGGAGQWAIQVGAFGNEGLAHIAVGNAREQAGSVLASARPAVAGVREPHGTLYRARLIGLSRDAASQACERLRSRTNCIVLSPEAQS
jgi:Transglycosylase SLT domain/SPOR domain